MSLLRVRENWIICITLFTILSSCGVQSQPEEEPISPPNEPSTGTIRFANGSKYSGRLEIFYDREWGTICNDGWKNTEAMVVCRSLGLGGGVAVDVPEGKGKIFLAKVNCTGDEPSILGCQNNKFQPHNCTHITDAGVKCEESGDVLNLIADGNTVDNCDFDRGFCDYGIRPTSGFKWLRRSGKTPSTDTGPTGDHTTTTGYTSTTTGYWDRTTASPGYYMYTEASSGRIGDTARMQTSYSSRWIGSIQFWYHMFGTNIGTLKVLIVNGTNISTVWSMHGNQGAIWKYASIEVQSTIDSIIFAGVRGGGFTGDIAVDDIIYSTNGSTAINNGSCTFEKSMCGYKAIQGNGSSVTWSLFPGSSYRTPVYDHSTNKSHGKYLALSTTYAQEGLKSYLLSKPMEARDKKKVEFYYYMNGVIPGEIQVSFRDMSVPLNVWTEYDWQDYGNHGRRWNYGCMDLHPEFNRHGNVTQKIILFTGITGTSSGINLALDDIKVSYGSCGVGIEYHMCTFQNPKLCHYTINCTAYDEYTWRRMRGGTPSMRTGPTTDVSRTYNGYYLYAESSYGKMGDAVSIKFPVKDSKGKYLKFNYHMYGQGMGSLDVIYSFKLSHKETAWQISGNQGNMWKFHCQKVNREIDAVSLIAVRGSTFTSDIAVDNVFLDTEGCPNAVNCYFENGMCNYTITYSTYTFKWQRVSGADHTYGVQGHYIQAVSPYRREGLETTMESSVIAENRNISSLQFYYQVIKFTGKFMVNLSRHSLLNAADNMESKVFKTNDEGWIMGCMDLPPNERVSVQFTSYSGIIHGASLMVDDVIYNEGPCVVGILDKTCTFDEPNVCGYKVSCREASQFLWRRGLKTVSSSTGPYTDHSVSGNGYFMYTESSFGSPGDTTYLEFPSFVVPPGKYLSFYYNMNGRDIGTLQVAIITDSGKELKWYLTGDQGESWFKGCVNLPVNKNVTVVFNGIRGNGPLGDIAIDDVDVVAGSCEDRDITCDFNDEMICGYKNESEFAYGSSWRRVRTSTGYAMSTTQGGRRHSLISPLKNVTDSCVQIFYRLMGQYCRLFVLTTHDDKQQLSLQYLNQTLEKAQFYVKQAETAIRFVGDHGRFHYMSTCAIQIEKVNVSNGACPALDCPLNTTVCADQTQCLPNSNRCNRIPECPDKSDEENCPTSISCDFEDNYLCGYNFSYGWYRTKMSRFANKDLFLNNSAYSMTLSQSRSSMFSPEKTINKSCLQFNYAGGTRTSLEVKANYINGMNVSKWYIDVSDLTKWTIGQFDLSPGTVQLEFLGTASILGLAIDNIQLQNGSCQQLNCSKDFFACSSNDRCIPQGSKCNRFQDCKDNSDELNCPTSIACDAEHPFQCGYTYGAGTWEVTSGMGRNLPDLDHSKGLYSGSYFASTFSYGNGSKHTLIAPEETLPTAACLTFHYSFHGTGEFEIFDNGVTRLVIRPNNINAWSMSSIQLSQGTHNITFIHRQGNDSILNYDNILALDSISITNGTCGTLECKTGWKKCSKSPICIPEFKFCDRDVDCPDREDENNCKNFTDVRLTDGRNVNQGFVEMFYNGTWNSICFAWYQRNAAIVCKQLGYNGTALNTFTTKTSSKFTRTKINRVICKGYEDSIAKCSISTCYGHCDCSGPGGVDCSNTHCPSTHVPCPTPNSTVISTSNVTQCIYKESVCDGEKDCPGATDEKSCPTCQNNEFQCHNYECISMSKQCDGVKDCKSGSDEFHCLKHANYTVTFMIGGKYLPVCEDNLKDQDVANRLCHYVGKGNASVGLSSYRTMGVLFSYSADAKQAVFPGFRMSINSCNILTIKCYNTECGTRSPNLYDTMIQHGQRAILGEYPWQAALYYNSKFVCGVVIINEWNVLTAAHCVRTSQIASRYRIYTGSIQKYGGTKYTIAKITMSPNFTMSRIQNDIALLQMDSPIKVTDYVRPICLPSKPWVPNTQCFVTGWGQLDAQTKANYLYEAKVYLLSREMCKNHYRYSDQSTVCANHNQPNQPACYGDSGGPLACRNEQGYWEVVGIVSYGQHRCAGHASSPQVFADVFTLRKWILDTLTY